MPYAIVTGASQGIGKTIAEALLSRGFSIAVCARNKERLETLQNQWNELYPTASIIALNADMGNKEDVAIFADTVLANFPHIDLLVNNAGTYQASTLADEPDGVLEKMISVNLYGAYHLTRKILPAMKNMGSGHIFNMCSVASLKAYPECGSYSISKYALLGFTDNLREELRKDNIKVTAICLGATYSSSWEGSGVDPKRIMEMTDIANTLWNTYTLSPQANIDTVVMRPVKGDL